jgi:hypothetical protein
MAVPAKLLHTLDTASGTARSMTVTFALGAGGECDGSLFCRRGYWSTVLGADNQYGASTLAIVETANNDWGTTY